MSETLIKAATEVGPKESEIYVAAVTTSSAATDLRPTPVGPYVTNGDFVTLFCDQLLYYRFSSNPAAVADDTAVVGATQVAALPAGTRVRELIPKGMPYLVTKAAVAGTVRIWGSSGTIA